MIKITLVALVAVSVSALGLAAGNPSDAVYAAVRTNDVPKLQALSKQAVNAADDRGMTPLMYAAEAGSPEAMKLLLDKGANVNAVNAFGSTALMWSVTDMKKVRMLVDKGANVNLASKQGHTALLLAAMSDHSSEIVKLLLSKGANPKAVDQTKTTALIAATMGNDTETIRQMIAAGLDVNALNMIPGTTPLMNAATNGNLEAVKLLLAKGANVNAVSGEPGQTVKNGTIALGRFTALNLAAAYGPVEIVKALLDAGANVNAKEARGMTSLMLAVATDRQDPEVVKALLAKGADVNIKSQAGETALDWARKIGQPSTIDLLVRAKAVETKAAAVKVPPAAPVDARHAVDRSLALMDKISNQFLATGGCVSCHHQNITDIAMMTAKGKGIAVNEKSVAERQKVMQAFFGSAGPALLERNDLPGSPELPSYALAALAAGNYAADRMTDAMVANIVAQQFADGHYHAGGIARPPIEDGDIFRTALGIRVMKAYGSPGRGAEMAGRIENAKNWMLRATAATAEDRNMQLLGLTWAGADPPAIQKLVKGIQSAQRPDGGWSQHAQLQSDAYATGQTLYALGVGASISSKDAGFQKGVKYLLSTQRADGSWYVKSRAPKFQPYFESGFPYGHDQWISSMATGWAAAGLALSLDTPVKTAALH